ncbi:MAG: hypothetical protein KA354_20865 [Phycisphaerae bacterium]|nr:hypothetical protein [Phycisphaerae bacterium]
MSSAKSVLVTAAMLSALLWLCPGQIRGQDLLEACCLPGGVCALVPVGTCVPTGGFLAPGGVCLGDLNGNQIDDACEITTLAEACCPPDGRCYMELPQNCRASGGEPKGPGTVCLGDKDGDGLDEVCEGGPLKFIQPPDINKTGIDVKATFPVILADDFKCDRRSLITHITVWGSWLQDILPGIPPDAGNVTFTLSLHADIPAVPGALFSRPGKVLWTRTFQPGTFTVGVYLGDLEEYWWDPTADQGLVFPGDKVCWQYDFWIPASEAFCQEGHPEQPVVYWLDVQAQTMPGVTPAYFGWKTSYHHWNDAAVVGVGSEPYTGPWRPLTYPDGHIWYPEPIDLAFAIEGDLPCVEELDWGDAPDPTYPTLAANMGANHLITPGLMLGNLIDPEADGQPNGTATGDDLNNLPDEDGVAFPTAMFTGVPNTVNVTVTNMFSAVAYLNAWVDFDGNGSWADAGEQIFTDVPVVNGVNILTFTPGAITATGRTFARFRLSTVMGLPFTGPAPNGEVEDYLIKIAPVKWIQPPDVEITGVDVDNFWVQLADDFRCTQTGPITDFHIWTSFNGDLLPPNGLNSLVFKLYLYADVPAGPNGTLYSHPGELLWEATFEPGQYQAGLCTVVPGEWWFDPATNSWHFPGDTQIYQYDFYINENQAFHQFEGTIYWLGVKYMSEIGTDCALGWKTSRRHWNDDACWLDNSGPAIMWRELRYGDGHPMAPDSIDLAFAVTGMAGPDVFDFGDAPAPYPTLLAANGARHVASQALMLGKLIDVEGNGLPNPTATGDDITNLADEDGVTFHTAMFSGVPNTVTVTVTNFTTAVAYLSAWVDFDGNGSWANAGEQIFADVPVANGINNLTFVPGAITAVGQTFTRFRLSLVQGLSFTGPAPNGEVEDYLVTIAPVKWLQRPDVHTTGVDVNNARVELADDFKCTMSGPITDIHIWTSFLHDILPPEGPASLGFTLTLYADVPAAPPLVPYSHPGIALWKKHFAPGEYKAGLCLHERAEWWHDPVTGEWQFPGDTQIYQYDFYINKDEAFRQREGTIYWLGVKYKADDALFLLGWKSSLEHWNDDACYMDLTQPVPGWKELRYGGNHPMARESMDLAFALTGIFEVVEPTDDFGDAPDPTYPTLLGNNGARHTVVPGLMLGALIDAEGDGQPNPTATGDDLAALADEDGVVFRNTPLTPGHLGCVDVTASAPGLLSAWLDFGGNGSWADTGDQIFADVPLVAGVNSLVFPVPITAAGGTTFARFRFSTVAGLSYIGHARDGEVEDYTVQISATPAGVLEVYPADDLYSAGNPGGPFVPGSKSYTLTNAGGQTINWSAANLQPWVTLSPPVAGSLTPGASTNVTVSINALANALPAGLYNDTVTFANTTNGNVYTLATNEGFGALPADWQIFPFANHQLPEGVVRLISSGFISKAGTAFYSPSPVAEPGTSNDFEVSFDFKLANVSGHYADAAGNIDPDGLTMVVSGAPSGPFYPEGVGIGYRDFPTQSFAVEFDGYMNNFDPDSNHVGVDVGGSVVSKTTTAISPDFEDTGVWHAVVRFKNGVLNVVVTPPGLCPIHAIRDYTVPAANIPDVKYVGFTSAAGGNSADTDVDNVVIKVFDQGGKRNVVLRVRDRVPPVMTAAVSRKTHGTMGTFDIDLLSPLGVFDAAVECRRNGPTLVLVTFDESIMGSGPGGTPLPADVSVVDSAGSAVTINSVSIAGAVLTIDMSGVADVSRVSIRFPGITDLSGNVTTSSICMVAFVGDVNGDGRCNTLDMTPVRNNTGEVPLVHHRCDINMDGRINTLDMTAVRNNIGQKLPPPPCP